MCLGRKSQNTMANPGNTLPPETRLSVVIPALNEAALLADKLRRLGLELAPGDELIVADGGSGDGTRCIAQEHARLVDAPRGRARQLNAGAAAATGEVLLFLHADVELPHDWRDQILAALGNPDVVGGGFLIRADPRSAALDFITALSNFRSRYRRRFYGDQGIFVRAEAFREVAGFDESLPLFEGYDLTRRLRRFGRIACVRRYVRASSRRFLERGVWRTFLTFHSLKLRYLLGRLPANVDELYPGNSE